MKTSRIILSAALSLLACIPSLAQRPSDGLAKTPPMGWNSWNCFQGDINENKVKEIVDLIVSSGMKDAGYEYLNIDDCWQESRDKNGKIVVNAEKFPSGIKADYVHSKGLKFGIYSCAGSKTCAGWPGSQGHEYQDALTYAEWGVDFLKEDWCNTFKNQDAFYSYTLMRDALDATGRPMILSICEWGSNSPWLWGEGVGHMWRTTGDIIPLFEGKVYWGGLSIAEIIDKNADLYPWAGPGHWNDPDMLQVGNGSLTYDENKTHFSMWCMMAAPLLAGNDLRKVSKENLEILLNKEAIAIDQDPLGIQGRRYYDYGNEEIWVKKLSDGAAVCFYNRGNSTWKASFNFAGETFGPAELDRNAIYKVRDVWAHKDLGGSDRVFSFDVPAHGVVMLRLTK